MKKHYWKKNEILYLKELHDKYTTFMHVHWDWITKEFNEKYNKSFSADELKRAYEYYFKER